MNFGGGGRRDRFDDVVVVVVVAAADGVDVEEDAVVSATHVRKSLRTYCKARRKQ